MSSEYDDKAVDALRHGAYLLVIDDDPPKIYASEEYQNSDEAGAEDRVLDAIRAIGELPL